MFSPDGIHLATSCLGGKVRMWNLTKAYPTVRIISLPDQAFRMAFNQDGSRLLVSDGSQSISLWDPPMER